MSTPPAKSQQDDPKRSTRTRDDKGDVAVGASTSIVGNLNTGVVISSGSVTAVNVGGSTIQGDIYRTTGLSVPGDIELAINELPDATPDQKNQLLQALTLLEEELAKGPQCDESMVNLLVTDMKANSTSVARLTAQWIVDQPNTTDSVKAIARQLTV